MQSSTGQWASQMGEPAQLEQFSFMTAKSAVPLRFFVASAIRLRPRSHKPSFRKKSQGHQQEHPPITDQAYAAPLQPVNKIGRLLVQPAQNLLRPRIIT